MKEIPAEHCTVPSFAKFNWHLEVLGRRPDGFHEIRTLFQTMEFHDEIHMELCDGEGRLIVEGDPDLSSGCDNLVWQAVDLFKSRAGVGRAFCIRLRKRIPVSAGLGGGSSNAALALMSANYLSGRPLRPEELRKLGQELGSDVVFFLEGGTVLGAGRGEQLHPLPDMTRSVPLLVICPEIPVSAADAYRWLDAPQLARDALELTRNRLDTTIRQFRQSVEADDWRAFRNDLEPAVLERFPILRHLKECLKGRGLPFQMMAGSGSCLIASGEPAALESAAHVCGEQLSTKTVLTRTLSRQEYRKRLGFLLRPGDQVGQI